MNRKIATALLAASIFSFIIGELTARIDYYGFYSNGVFQISSEIASQLEKERVVKKKIYPASLMLLSFVGSLGASFLIIDQIERNKVKH